MERLCGHRQELKVEPKNSIEDNWNILQGLLSLGLVRSDIDKPSFNVLLEVLIQTILKFYGLFDSGLIK